MRRRLSECRYVPRIFLWLFVLRLVCYACALFDSAVHCGCMFFIGTSSRDGIRVYFSSSRVLSWNKFPAAISRRSAVDSSTHHSRQASSCESHGDRDVRGPCEGEPHELFHEDATPVSRCWPYYCGLTEVKHRALNSFMIAPALRTMPRR